MSDFAKTLISPSFSSVNRHNTRLAKVFIVISALIGFSLASAVPLESITESHTQGTSSLLYGLFTFAI